jgi:hypothetical protein
VFVGLGLVAMLALAAAAVLELSGVTLVRDESALARVEVQALGGTLQPPRANDAEGRPIALVDRGGTLTPARNLTRRTGRLAVTLGVNPS